MQMPVMARAVVMAPLCTPAPGLSSGLRRGRLGALLNSPNREESTMHDPGPAFRALHRRGDPFVLANAWDIGSARVLAALGAQAIGTSSAAHAFTLGLPDGARITRDQALAHAADLVAATPCRSAPISRTATARTRDRRRNRAPRRRGRPRRRLDRGHRPARHSGAYAFDLAVERIRAAVAAARALPRDFVLVARADGVMTGAYDLAEGIRRLRAFEAAGADCLYLPLPPDVDGLRAVCAAVRGPVNALAAGPSPGSPAPISPRSASRASASAPRSPA
jgi:hypothetical protein